MTTRLRSSIYLLQNDSQDGVGGWLDSAKMLDTDHCITEKCKPLFTVFQTPEETRLKFSSWTEIEQCREYSVCSNWP